MGTKLKTIVITGCSSIGKTTLAKYLLAKYPELSLVNSYTTRKKRHGDVNYNYISVEDFKQAVFTNQFADYNEVYTNTFYGTKWQSLQSITDKGMVPLLVVDNVGAANYYEITDCLLINLIPKNIEIIRQRILAGRKDRIEERLKTLNHGSLGYGNDFYVRNTFDEDEKIDEIESFVEGWINKGKPDYNSPRRITMTFGKINEDDNK